MSLELDDYHFRPLRHLAISDYYIEVDLSTKILEVNLFAFAYRLFQKDFSLINGATGF